MKKNDDVNIKMTPELQKKLRGFLGFKIDPVFYYVPKIFRNDKDIPKSLWPVFKLRGKTGIEIADAEDNAGFWDSSGSKFHMTIGRQRIEVLKKNILGWKNFKDENGDDIEFKRIGDEVYKTCIARLPSPLQLELHNAINEQSTLTDEELLGLEF